METQPRIKLSVWAKKNGFTYHQAHRMFHRGLLSGSQSKDGRIFVDEEQKHISEKSEEWQFAGAEAYLYACVSHEQNKEDSAALHGQLTRLIKYCEEHKHAIRHLTQEVIDTAQKDTLTRSKFNDVLKEVESQPLKRKVLIMDNIDRFTEMGMIILRRYLNLINTHLIVLSEVDQVESDVL